MISAQYAGHAWWTFAEGRLVMGVNVSALCVTACAAMIGDAFARRHGRVRAPMGIA